jgi:5-formyltetrahydrofolate cyclo-ligase
MPIDLWRAKSDRLCEHLQKSPLFAQARTVLAYFSFRQEPDLSPLFENEYCWGFPRCVGRSLHWHTWSPRHPQRLQKSAYGIDEPSDASPIIQPQDVDLILVPTVACDMQGYRLGYGGGFYDRMLSQFKWAQIPTIGIVFDYARLSHLPVDSWDRPLQSICTEEGYFSVGDR